MSVLAPPVEAERTTAQREVSFDAASAAGDTLTTGLALLLGLTIVQRVVGFGRNLLFCRMLDDHQLGQWSILFNLLVLAAPLAVLGIPGSFGRYTEHYRQRGQLRTFLRRTTITTAALSLLTVILLCLTRHWCSWLVFSRYDYTHLILAAAGMLLPVIAFNYLVELFTALRLVRVVSIMQLVHSLAFAVVGLLLIQCTELGALAVLAGYGAACLLATGLAGMTLRRHWSALPRPVEPLGQRDLWSKLLPFAAWVWLINLLANLFGVVDCYMLVHLAGTVATDAHALVGQYHSSRVIPLLLVSMAMMVSSVILPYLSHDWEAGNRAGVSHRLRLALKLLGLSFTAVGVLVLVCSPLLFGWLLQGRYDDGLAVLPWTLIHSIWFSLFTLAHGYLWCAERGRICALIFAVGLVANIALNLLLVPTFGLHGAVWATAAANAACVLITFAIGYRAGMELDWQVVVTSALPLLLLMGQWSALLALGLVGYLAMKTTWVFNHAEQQLIAETCGRYRLCRGFINAA